MSGNSNPPAKITWYKCTRVDLLWVQVMLQVQGEQWDSGRGDHSEDRQGRRLPGHPGASAQRYKGTRVDLVKGTSDYCSGGAPITSEDNGSKFSCSVSNPAISGNNVTRDYTLSVRCKILNLLILKPGSFTSYISELSNKTLRVQQFPLAALREPECVCSKLLDNRTNTF